MVFTRVNSRQETAQSTQGTNVKGDKRAEKSGKEGSCGLWNNEALNVSRHGEREEEACWQRSSCEDATGTMNNEETSDDTHNRLLYNRGYM